MKKPIFALTMGDPGGIGPEIILKTLKTFPLTDEYLILLIGSQSVFDFASERTGIQLRFNPIPTLEESLLRDDSINLLDVSDEADLLYQKIKKEERSVKDVFDVGSVSLLNGTLAFASLQVAAYQGACGLIDAVVTAPVHKKAMQLVEPGFTGHTEYLAKVSRIKNFAMLFYSRYFCVTLATIHIPLKEVPKRISKQDLVIKMQLTNDFLREKLKIAKPRIAVASLNPHGSEFGTEEEEVILPAVKEGKKLGIRVEGPLPGDQVFYEAQQKRYDAVLAMYHDQGLAPFKMLAFETGVNVTLGLPFVRTSPDHGTAFDIAYEGNASPIAFREALQLAKRLVLKEPELSTK